MKILSTKIPDLYTINIDRHEDHRGFFARLYDVNVIAEATRSPISIKQINHSYTAKKGTIRGMHFQEAPYQEDKIVYCMAGEVFDVAIDIRPESATFLQWHAEILSAENKTALIIPKGFAHGFQALSNDVQLIYLMSEVYNKENENGIRFNDPSLNIEWPITCENISERDQVYPLVDHDFRSKK